MFYRRNIIPHIIGALEGMSKALVETPSRYLKGGETAMLAALTTNEMIFNIYSEYACTTGEKVDSDILRTATLDDYMDNLKIHLAAISARNGNEISQRDLDGIGYDVSDEEHREWLVYEVSRLRWISSKFPEDEFLSRTLRLVTGLLIDEVKSLIVMDMCLRPIIDVLCYELHREKLYSYGRLAPNEVVAFHPYTPNIISGNPFTLKGES